MTAQNGVQSLQTLDYYLPCEHSSVQRVLYHRQSLLPWYWVDNPTPSVQGDDRPQILLQNYRVAWVGYNHASAVDSYPWVRLVHYDCVETHRFLHGYFQPVVGNDSCR